MTRRLLIIADDAFTAEMIRIPTVNPPGEQYEECARLIGATLERLGFTTEYFAAEGRPEHTPRYPRLNVVGTRAGLGHRPTVHLNGHFDVVPAGHGWTLDPFRFERGVERLLDGIEHALRQQGALPAGG